MGDFRAVIETDSVALGWEDGHPALRRGDVVIPITDLAAADLVGLLDVSWEKAVDLDREFGRYVFSLERGEGAKSTEAADAIVWAGLRSGDPLRNRQALEWVEGRHICQEAALALRDFVEMPGEKEPETARKAGELLDRWRKKWMTISAQPPEKLKEFVVEVLGNRIFLSVQISHPEDITLVFPVLSMGALRVPEACLNWLPPRPVPLQEPVMGSMPPEPKKDGPFADYCESLKWDADCKKVRDQHRERLVEHKQSVKEWEIENKELLDLYAKRDELEERLFKEYVSQIGVVWEHYDKAMPRSVNGYPMFLSCHLMNMDDWERCLKVIREEQERRDKITV